MGTVCVTVHFASLFPSGQSQFGLGALVQASASWLFGSEVSA